MKQIILIIPLLVILIVQESTASMARRYFYTKVGQRLELDFYETPKKISRFVNAKNVGQTHVFTVCNGKNKAKCGFWLNTKTKKKVGPPTTYNKKKNLLIIPKVRALDAGTYYVNSYEDLNVYVM
uniref:Secreted protein n=1 Tax=Caenorhabditis tropicalis TaxID=1561998 RepID=A0A1I7T6Q7_9PELO